MRIVDRLIPRSKPAWTSSRQGLVARASYITTLEILMHDKELQEDGLIEAIAELIEGTANIW